MGCIGKQPPRPLLSPYHHRLQTAAVRDPRLEADRGDHRTLLRGQGGGFVMRFLRRFLARLKNFAARRRDDQRLREEMEEHLARQTEENLRAGMTPAEARRQAVLKFGAAQAVRENYHAEQGLPLMENLLQ